MKKVRGLPITPPNAVAERQAEADEDPQHADHAHRHEALEHRRHDVLGAHHPAVEKRQPRRHQQHETRGREHPRDVAGDERTAGHGLGGGAEQRAGDADAGHQQERQRRKLPKPLGFAPDLCQRHRTGLR
jgi:hypothetical protein